MSMRPVGEEGGMPPTSWALACGFRSFAGTLEKLDAIGPNAIKVAIGCTQSLEFDRDVNTAIIGLRPFALNAAGAEVYQKGALVRVNIRTLDNTALSVEAVFTDVWAND